MTVVAKEPLQTQELEGYFGDLGYGAGFGKTKNILMGNDVFFQKEARMGEQDLSFQTLDPVDCFPRAVKREIRLSYQNIAETH